MTDSSPSTVQDDTNNYFGITYPDAVGETLTLSMQAGTSQTLDFDILNRGGFLVRAQITREVASAEMANWFSGSAIQELPINIGETATYTMTIDLPDDALAGDYSFQLEIVDLALPDETLTRSQPIRLRVEPAADFSIPRWLIAVAVLLVVLIIGVGVAAFMLSRQVPEGNIWLAYTEVGPPSNLFARLPERAGILDEADARGVRLTTVDQYREFLNDQADIIQYAEYHPTWSPDGCQLLYGARFEIGRYFMTPDETLYDLQSFLSIPSDEMEAIAARILEYPALIMFLDENPAYARTALDSNRNPYLTRVAASTAQVSYYQRTLSVLSEPFAAQFYRHVAGVIYTEIDRATLHGLFNLRFDIPADEPDSGRVVPVVERIAWARLEGNTTYIPAYPDWNRLDDSDLFAFAYVEDIQRPNTPGFLAANINGINYLLRPADLQADDGLYYDRDPVWWSDGSERGLFFTSRRDLNYDGLRQAQIYRMPLDIESFASAADARADERIVLQETDFASLPTGTPAATPSPVADDAATPRPTASAIPTLFPQVLQYTPVFTLTPFVEASTPVQAEAPSAESTAVAATATPASRLEIAALPAPGVLTVQNISGNSVNDSQPVALGRMDIVFVSDRDGSNPYESQHLYRLDFETGSDGIARRLTADEANVLEYEPALAADGQQIVYVRQTGRAPQLYYVDIFAEEDPVRITSSSAEFNTSPAWQPRICESAGRYIQSLRQEASS